MTNCPIHVTHSQSILEMLNLMEHFEAKQEPSMGGVYRSSQKKAGSFKTICCTCGLSHRWTIGQRYRHWQNTKTKTNKKTKTQEFTSSQKKAWSWRRTQLLHLCLLPQVTALQDQPTSSKNNKILLILYSSSIDLEKYHHQGWPVINGHLIEIIRERMQG